MTELAALIQTQIVKIENLDRSLKLFSLGSATEFALPPFPVGGHVSVCVQNNMAIKWCDFSLINDTDNTYWQIIVQSHQRDIQSRSHMLFHASHPGDKLIIKPPLTGMTLKQGKKHLFIAGGSGASGLLGLAHQAQKLKLQFEFHHGIRYLSGFQLLIRNKLGENYKFYNSSSGIRMNINELIINQPAETHIYVCGPISLLADTIQSAHEFSWPLHRIHWDRAFDCTLLNMLNSTLEPHKKATLQLIC
ncbi:MAG: hypothetical protein KGI54_13420 [Pseudomonadota bacterium]|nr:hypothetical protein [Pseudomonadota bacterium]